MIDYNIKITVKFFNCKNFAHALRVFEKKIIAKKIEIEIGKNTDTELRSGSKRRLKKTELQSRIEEVKKKCNLRSK